MWISRGKVKTCIVPRSGNKSNPSQKWQPAVESVVTVGAALDRQLIIGQVMEQP